MAKPHEKLAESLEELRNLQKDGRRVFRSNELSRPSRSLLLKNGFLRDIMKGWVVSSSPGSQDGDSTPWYASFWEFCVIYCNDRFGDNWNLSPEQSLLLHAENTVVPSQLIVHSTLGSNNTIDLLFGTSLYDLKQSSQPPNRETTHVDGLRLYSSDVALTKVPDVFFRRHPIETQVALVGINDLSVILDQLLAGGRSSVAGRLAGAFRRVGKPDLADDILETMQTAGYDVRESDPFEPDKSLTLILPKASPIVRRLTALWESSRSTVLAGFPPPPGLPGQKKLYLQSVEDIYTTDAYHSLSIEGYHVSPELVNRVRAGQWDPMSHEEDRKSRDALAARGYWQAFQKVKSSIEEIITGVEPGQLVRRVHRQWYLELFQPCVASGFVSPTALAGYRHDAVFLRTSRYVPPRWESVRDAMPALFDLLEQETEPAVRAVLGHWLFGFIHPYPEGNGRMARFLMNAMLASGGYPWTIIRVEDRTPYLTALDEASINANLEPFTCLLAERVREAIDNTQA